VRCCGDIAPVINNFEFFFNLLVDLLCSLRLHGTVSFITDSGYHFQIL
jgi:hypothetical protein